jgi:hypothetical protein
MWVKSSLQSKWARQTSRRGLKSRATSPVAGSSALVVVCLKLLQP